MTSVKNGVYNGLSVTRNNELGQETDPVEIRNCTIGELDLFSVYKSDITISDCTIRRICFDDAEFQSKLILEGCVIKAKLSFENAVINEVEIRNCTFENGYDALSLSRSRKVVIADNIVLDTNVAGQSSAESDFDYDSTTVNLPKEKGAYSYQFYYFVLIILLVLIQLI